MSSGGHSMLAVCQKSTNGGRNRRQQLTFNCCQNENYEKEMKTVAKNKKYAIINYKKKSKREARSQLVTTEPRSRIAMDGSQQVATQ